MLTRVISAAVVAPIVLGALFWSGGSSPFPGWPFALLIALLCLIGLGEFYGGCRTAGYAPLDGFGYAAAIVFLGLSLDALNDSPVTRAIVRDPEGVVLKFAITALVITSLVAETLRRDRAPLRNLAVVWLGALYVGWLFPFAVRLRLSSPTIAQHLGWSLPDQWMTFAGHGAWLVFFTLVTTSAVDTGAYFFGRAYGRHKMAPVLSPKKTWEGAVGGFLLALLVGYLLARWLAIPVGFALFAAGLVGVLAQLGDLAKSAVKREIGLKDFGALIPGHGGILDRFDSLLFTAPTVYWLMLLWGP